MTCALHEWYFETACPKCAPPVTVTETDYGDGSVPSFLQRNADGSFKYPYSLDPEESAARRKLEYALDEKKEQGHGDDTAIGTDGGNISPVHDLGD